MALKTKLILRAFFSETIYSSVFSLWYLQRTNLPKEVLLREPSPTVNKVLLPHYPLQELQQGTSCPIFQFFQKFREGTYCFQVNYGPQILLVLECQNPIHVLILRRVGDLGQEQLAQGFVVWHFNIVLFLQLCNLFLYGGEASVFST